MNDKKLIEEAWKIAKECLKDVEPAHGIKHTKWVFGYFKSLKKNIKKIDKKIIDALEYAVILHDIGCKIGRKNHNLKSIILLEECYSEFFLKLPNKEIIKYAIENHPGGNGKSLYDQCLAFLTFLDHMDTMGKRGFNRARDYLNSFPEKIPDLPKNKVNKKLKVKKELEEWFCFPTKINEDQKNSSLLEHLCFNYYWTRPNFIRVEGMLSEKFIADYKKLNCDTKKEILKLIKK